MDLHTITDVVVARQRADLTSLGSSTAVLAGGTFLFSEPQDQLIRLVDITALEWPAFEIVDDGLEIAATCTLAEFAGAAPGHELGKPTMRDQWPATALFAQSCRALLASHKIWDTATVGGNVCLALPVGAVLGALVALDGVALVWAADGADRCVALRDFVVGPRRTVLRPDEIVRSIRVPWSSMTAHTSFRKIGLTALGRSGAVVMGRRDRDDRTAITVTAATTTPVVVDFDLPPSERRIRRALDELDPACWLDDPHGSPQWRRHVAGVLAGQVAAELRGS
ncbi:xanthine dehydrogenase family protein subunit M [Nocardia sp. CNY236]|uniref:FAD binding domain-containing protein n=1 Tax=Nocardia sp. CNY236 TaxID=1169152 RepID=UPI0004286B83|nr:FAD binding domain-containing protein [Nocardia sp. CNY236]